MNVLLKPLIAGGLLIGALGLVFSAGHMKGKADGRRAQLEDTVKAYETREGIKSDVAATGKYDRCLELGGLPVDCEQLRGVE